MATGMRNWLGLLALGMALVAVWALPPRGPRTIERGIQWPQEQQLRELHSELQTKQAVLRRIRWSDSLSALTLNSATDGITVLFPESHEVSEEFTELFRAGLDAELQRLSGRSDLAFSYVFQDQHHGRITDMNTGGIGLGEEFYAGVRDGQAYCMKVRPTGDDRHYNDITASLRLALDGQRVSNYIGACRSFVEFGYPGPAILAWLEQGALEFGAKPWEYGRDDRFEAPARTGPFGMRSWFYSSYRSLATEQCLTGNAAACLERVTEPESLHWRRDEAMVVVSGSPLTGVDDQDWRSPLERSDDYLLSDLTREFGHDAFLAFWTSDKEVPEAFQEAFGADMGEWVSSWVTDQVGMSKAGPGLTRSAGVGGLLAMSALAIIGGAWSRRRRVA